MQAWWRQRSTAVRDRFLLLVAHNGMCAIISAALATHAARFSRISALQPADVAEVMGPGTATSGRARSLVCRAVARVPPRSAASITTVPRASAAIMRLRARNRRRLGVQPGG